MQLNIIKNKRAQIGETLTWVVALLVILFIMALFALATLEIAKLKGVQPAGTLAADKMQFS